MTSKRIAGRWTCDLAVMLSFCLPVTGTTAAQLGNDSGSAIPAHPSKISFPELNYELPPASQFREVLSNGMVVFIAEDRALPTFDMTVTIRTGSWMDPAFKSGLADLVAEQMRDGGTLSLTPEELDEQVEFLAASLYSGAGETSAYAGLSCLAKDIDEGLGLLIDMLRNPRFDDERLRLAKERMIQNVKRRNDSTATIEAIEWGFLIYGSRHFSNYYPSSESIRSIETGQMFGFHQEHYHPGNMILTVAGDFDRSEMLSKLEKLFADWPAGKANTTPVPKPDEVPEPGVYVVHKPEVNQGRVSIGHAGIERGTPDEHALIVMDSILGAGGFRSRLVAKVRSDEGLAYQVRSSYDQGTFYPGDFRCFFQSKSNSCAYAVKLIEEEIDRIRTEQVSAEELADAVAYLVEGFPQRFPDKMAILRAYAADEYTGRNLNYWPNYVVNIKKVTAADVLRVAQNHLFPHRLVILAVGDAPAMIKGGYDKAPDLGLESFGKVTRWPLRDPDTLER